MRNEQRHKLYAMEIKCLREYVWSEQFGELKISEARNRCKRKQCDKVVQRFSDDLDM